MSLHKSKNQLIYLLWGVGFLIYLYFGWRSLGANISADDAGFIYGITGGTPSTWFQSIISYVPGRNLHILWQAILFTFTGGSMGDLRNYHLFQAIFFGLVGLLVLLVLRKGGTSSFVSISLGLLVLVFPLFSSILLWANSLPQHIISSLLFLVGVYLVLPHTEAFSERKPRLNSSLALLALTLSMFTYDQSAAATGVLALLFVAKSIFGRKAQWIPVRTSIFLTSMLGFSLVSYIYVFFLGRGTGDNLTFGSKTLGRLFENLIIPTKVMSKFRTGSSSGKSYFHFEPYVILWVLFILISLVILILTRVLLSREHMSPKVGIQSLSLAGLFLLLALAAYLPAAIWYVAPRHLYFPALLCFISIGFIFQYISLRIPAKSPIRIFSSLVAVFVFLGSAFGFNGQLDTWMDRDLYRKNFYQALEPALVSQGIDCVVMSRVLNNSDTYLYSESINLAMGYYNGTSIGDSRECTSVPAERDDHVFSCAEGNRENWSELVSYTFERDTRKFNFNFKELCASS